jgi:acetylornithine deacetylase
MDTQAEAKILAAVDDLFEAQVRLTQDLVRFPSLRGQEHTIQDSVYEVLRSRGAVMDRCIGARLSGGCRDLSGA